MPEKSVLVDFDFAVLDGGGVLFSAMGDFLKALDGIAFDDRVEVEYMTGRDYLSAFSAYFPVVRTKKTALKASRDFAAAFSAALGAAAPTTLPQGFRNFLKTVTDRGAGVVVMTRAPIASLAMAFADFVSDKVVLHHFSDPVYGGCRWDTWLRVAAAHRLRVPNALAVTGSACGVKAALRAGVASAAVVGERVAYQDFSGADAVFGELSAPAARTLLSILRVA